MFAELTSKARETGDTNHSLLNLQPVFPTHAQWLRHLRISVRVFLALCAGIVIGCTTGIPVADDSQFTKYTKCDALVPNGDKWKEFESTESFHSIIHRLETEGFEPEEQLLLEKCLDEWRDETRKIPPAWYEDISSNRVPKYIAFARMVSYRTSEMDEATFYQLLDKAAFREVVSHTPVLDLGELKLKGHQHERLRTVLSIEELVHVEDLRLWDTKIGDEEIEILATTPYLVDLRHLRVGGRGSSIGDAGITSLGKSPNLQNLESLSITHTQLQVSDIEILSETGIFPSLRILDLGFNSLTSEALEILAYSPLFAQLTALKLPYNEIDCDGVEYLVDSYYWSQLRELSLFRNKIGDRGAKALADSNSVKSLRRLLLTGNRISFEMQQYLRESPNLKDIELLAISRQSPRDD